ncbi:MULTISPECIES: STAS domain-containing protein [Metabacillus]|uniref:STAS domain-containing protein n=1 Tax=Metabacillus hrfriensis TaxID=3048891 RepID=A0ACD4R9G7_9BACI|nr:MULTISPECIES: STAS domain-containing protein [Metabacillus]UAL51577.1 STAS domain-containing protein [Metabacillus dongyingensis]USK27883.1 STAS domain-containing protein [Bacillus sp. CMF21]WHZ57091.1 STAS domain-containing protein [Metabacillus sp. CT-WN-B3]
MSLFFIFSKYIRENVESLAIEVVESVLHRMKLDIPEWEKEQAIAIYVELLSYFGESLINEGKDLVPDTFIVWSKRNAAMQVSSRGKISEIAVRYSPTRDVFTEILTKISIDLGLSVKENALIIKRINTMLDISLNETVFAFERLLDEAREETKKELAALSAPIIPVKDGVVILPLVGYIDSYRANYIMEYVVPKIADMDINHVIADFSGIFTINIDIAEHIHQIGSMLQLMGIHVITTGLRPELAQLVINSRINISAIETFANVKKALESIK